MKRDRAITTQQVADILNVSPSYLVKLLDEGVIPDIKVSSEPYILYEVLELLIETSEAEGKPLPAIKKIERLFQVA